MSGVAMLSISGKLQPFIGSAAGCRQGHLNVRPCLRMAMAVSAFAASTASNPSR